jgi:hypothetical protein
MKRMTVLKLLGLLLLGTPLLLNGQVQWQPATNALQTAWAGQVNPDNVLPEYPRPQMSRPAWGNLNGLWEYAILPTNAAAPAAFQGRLLVPFPIESGLSGVQKRIGLKEALWYKRTFKVGKLRPDRRVLVHFGAVDWEARVFLNGKEVGQHRGGYQAFSLDVTPFLNGATEELVVRAWDPMDDGDQPRGKQVRNPGGIYYTPVSGIWQTVWYEVVPATYFESYQVNTDVDAGTVTIVPRIYNAAAKDRLKVKISSQRQIVAEKEFALTDLPVLQVPDPKVWSPASPNLYDLELVLLRQGRVVDAVKGYFGMRTIEVAKDAQGVLRLFLNHRPLFQYGPLDQGFWPEGIYTAPTEEALLSDIQTMKAMGFNMVRKHVKVEPQRWYYHCDRLGLIVWQDMPSGFGEIVPVKDHDHSIEGSWLAEHYQDVTRSYLSEQNFRRELQQVIDQLRNHPSICVWVPFNESWGQFKTEEILHWVKELDPTRLVDGPSGWIDRGNGDLHDYHLYGDRLAKAFGPEAGRAVVIGEFGGLGYPVQEHLFSAKSWSYQGYKDPAALEAGYRKLVSRIVQLRDQGCAAAIYTQLTDVETEINGLLTYDRQVSKIPAATLQQIHRQLYDAAN